MKEIFNGIFAEGKSIYTKNLLPGKKIYGERLLNIKDTQYREWDVYRSKYGAGIVNGIKESIFFNGASVLYLGSAEGTTVSHVSDIVGEKGNIFCVDISEIAMNKLSKLAEERTNLFPVLSDAQITDNYKEYFEEKVDAMFQDISQRNQAEIFVRNAQFLKKGGLGALALKTKSISQSEKKEIILQEEKNKLEKDFEIMQVVDLEPFEKEHYLILVRKK
ncbi:MAG: fibrillarin-like rRNA/tRNA 2'-O-methyltransferase [archaeon]|jgi:fibrillarin-like pre-rRNA processing protein